METILIDLVILNNVMENIKELALENDSKTFNLIHLLQVSLNKTIEDLNKIMKKES